MTIAYVERNKKGLTINCSGPDGNAFQLLRTASDLGRQMGKTQKQIDKKLFIWILGLLILWYMFLYMMVLIV